VWTPAHDRTILLYGLSKDVKLAHDTVVVSTLSTTFQVTEEAVKERIKDLAEEALALVEQFSP
jgi:hypothetical protein